MAGKAPVPPQSAEAEDYVLGAMMLSPGAIEAVAEEITADDFYRPTNARIYAAAVDLHANGEPVDVVTLHDELERRDQMAEIGRTRLHQLAVTVPASRNARHYAVIVRELAMLRGLIAAGQEITALGWDRPGEARDLLDQAEQIVFDLAETRERVDVVRVGVDIDRTYERLVDLHQSGVGVVGVPTGFERLDGLTAGLQAGSLAVLAARPSMGKSALALGILADIAIHQKRPALLFTLEMNRAEVQQRLISIAGLVDSQKLRTGRLDGEEWSKVMHAMGLIKAAPLDVDDSSATTMVEIRSKARRVKARHPDLALVVIDYLQLMTSGTTAENRVQEVSQISRGLKVLARDLDVPVLALSQLNRGVEQRHDKRPMLSDLRESGSIEQDADLVLMLYRDEYYHPEDSEASGVAEVNVAKQRNGPTGSVRLSFVERYARFSDLAYDS